MKCNVHVCSPSSITVVLTAGFSHNKLGPLTPTLSVWHDDNLCNKVQVAAHSIIMALQRARHHLIICCSFQTDFPLFTAPWFAPWSGLSYSLTTQRQLCSTAPLAGREIQCGQVCNLGKSVDLILNLLYMLTHPTVWNQIFFQWFVKVQTSPLALSHYWPGEAGSRRYYHRE